MVEITGLPIERVRVSIGALEVGDQVGVVVGCASDVIRTGFDGVDGIFHCVGVEVAHDDEVRIAAAGGIGCQPIDQSLGCQGTRSAAVALAVTQIRVANVIAVRTFGFEVIDRHSEAPAGSIDPGRSGRARGGSWYR